MQAKEHSFSIVTAAQEEVQTMRSMAGFEDATAVVREGKVHFDFNRYAASLDDAVTSALDEITRRGFKVVRVDT